MTTQTESGSDWATARGRELKARREQRLAEQTAAEAEAARGQAVDPALAHERFRAVVADVLEQLGRFATEAEVTIEAPGMTNTSLELIGPGREELHLTLSEDYAGQLTARFWLRVHVKGPSRGELWPPIDLSDEAFAPADVAARIARAFVEHLTAQQEGSHVSR